MCWLCACVCTHLCLATQLATLEYAGNFHVVCDSAADAEIIGRAQDHLEDKREGQALATFERMFWHCCETTVTHLARALVLPAPTPTHPRDLKLRQSMRVYDTR